MKKCIKVLMVLVFVTGLLAGCSSPKHDQKEANTDQIEEKTDKKDDRDDPNSDEGDEVLGAAYLEDADYLEFMKFSKESDLNATFIGVMTAEDGTRGYLFEGEHILGDTGYYGVVKKEGGFKMGQASQTVEDAVSSLNEITGKTWTLERFE